MATDVQTRSLSGLTGGRRGAFLAYRWLLLAFLLAGAAQIMKLTAAPAGAARVSAGLWAGIVLAAFAGAALTLLARGNLKASDLTANLGTTVAVVAYATLGALIVRRAGNLIGWLMLGEGAGLGPADRGPAVQPDPLRRGVHRGRVRGAAERHGGPGLGPRRSGRRRAPGPGTRPPLGVDQAARVRQAATTARPAQHRRTSMP
jgi:hypothetical protein